MSINNKITAIIRWFLIAFLVSLPLQHNLETILSGLRMSHFIGYLDEIVIVIFAPLAIISLHKNKRLTGSICLVMLIQMSLFAIIGFIAGFINANALHVSAMGIFDYLKNFMVLIIYFAFFKDINDFRRIFRLIMAVAIVIGAISVIQEAWAMVSVHIVKREISDPGNYILNNMDIDLTKGYWRFGMFRAPSLLSTSIISGLYCLLVLNIYMWTTKKINPLVAASLLSGVLTSISRLAYTGFILVAGLQIFRGRRWMILLLIPVMCLVFFMSNYRDFNIIEFVNYDDVLSVKEEQRNHSYGNLTELQDEKNDSYPLESGFEHLREYSRDKALEIWKDHPLWGVGPGMFGATVSLIFNSHIYNEYNFIMINYLRFLGNIDNFWFQLLAEMGIVGVSFFAGLILTIFLTLFLSSKRIFSSDLKGLCRGLMVYMVVICFYTFGMGLNIPSILFTYCALTGVGLASTEKGYQ